MIKLKENKDFSDYTCIIPSVSVANVPQLAVDLIIATLKMKRIGDGWHPALIGVFGPPAFEHDTISKTLSFELYCDDDKKLFVFQFRSPLIGSLVKDFHNELIDFIKTNKFKNIIILSSCHAHEKHDIESTSFEYLSTDKFYDEHKNCIEKQNWNKFMGKEITFCSGSGKNLYDFCTEEDEINDDYERKNSIQEKNLNIYGSGNGKNLYDLCANNEMNVFLLFKYVSEGDNTEDAKDLLIQLNQLYEIFDDNNKNDNGQIQLTIPISWDLLFGNEPPELIF